MLLVKSNESKNSDNNLARVICFILACPSFPVVARQSEAVSAGSYISVLLSLLVVVGIIFMLAFVMRRFNITQSGSDQMKVVSSMIVGSRERILIIEVGEEQHMIGITGHNISHLAKLDNKLEIRDPAQDFKSKLADFMSGKITGTEANKDKG